MIGICSGSWEDRPFRSREQRRVFRTMGEHRSIHPKGNASGRCLPEGKHRRGLPRKIKADTKSGTCFPLGEREIWGLHLWVELGKGDCRRLDLGGDTVACRQSL